VPPALKIVHIDTGTELRGGQEVLLLLARGLRRRGHQQLLVCPEGSALAARARQEGLRISTLPRFNPGHIRGILRLRRQLRAESFQLIHAHDGHAQTISFLASAGLPVRRVASRHVAFYPRHPTVHRLKYSLTCHAIIAPSQCVRRLLVSLGVPETKIEVVRGGVETPPELPGPEVRSRVRAQWGFGEDEFVVGHAAAFTPEKGQEVALEAAILLADRLPQARLVLAGDGPTRTSPSMAERLRRTGGRARLLGHVENLTGFFAALDLYIMPSRSESWGLAALDAMAHGLPVVASDVGGLPEVIEEGATGWLIPPGAPAALADAIATAAADPQRLRQLGRNARRRASQFSSEQTVARVEAVYYRVLAGRCET
jgi:glycosyltransferase involved in cell wall biosynthesis